ncbi:hypothetical protein H7097_04285 [Aeromicrobium sp.]|nr:hypothetical protein [Candidatus Saccharibacteria bacterium]
MAIKNRTQRIVMLAFVMIFAVAGSATLLASHADSNPSISMATGSYILNDFKQRDVGTYTFGMTALLLYCFNGNELKDGQTVSITEPGAATQTVRLVQDEGNYCFQAPQTFKAAQVQFAPAPTGPTLLVR